MKTFAVLFVVFSGCFAGEGKTIIFPRETATDHVILKPTGHKPLHQLSVCLCSYTDLSREHSLFSIAMPGSGKDNTFLIFPKPPNACSVYINQEEIRFTVDPETLNWKRTCVTWDSKTGLVKLWINGKRYPTKSAKNRSPIGPEMCVVLGQEQDSLCGGFVASQSLVGEIRDVHMWDYVLSPKAIQNLSYSKLQGNIFSCLNGTTEMKGESVVLEN